MSPTLDDDLSLAQRVENLAVEQLIAKEVVEQVEHPILASIVGVILDDSAAQARRSQLRSDLFDTATATRGA
jgi:hypothetical protein